MVQRADPSSYTESTTQRKQRVYRHALAVRVSHWANLVFFAIMLMSGLQIFNAHPALYWGNKSNFADPYLALYAKRTDDGRIIGQTDILGHTFNTTGWLGASGEVNGQPVPRGFPAWITIPSVQWLAMGRRWHFFFAWLFVLNGFCYLVYAVLSRHLTRDLVPHRPELRRIGHSIWEHLRFRFPEGEEARRYNVLQKLTYIVVLFVLGPLILLTGLTMSPTMDTVFPWLLDVFGGRQGARTIHFLCAFSFVAFALVHIFMVLVSGVWNNLRSMVTGWYTIKQSGERDE